MKNVNILDESRRVLVIDTTIRGAFAAIACPSSGGGLELLSYVHRTANKVAAAGISELCAEALAGAQCKFGDLDLGIVGHGPGSFTGIKVGLAFVHGLEQAQPKLKFIACSSLITLARQRPQELWFLPATKSQGYAALSVDGVQVESWVVDLNQETKQIKLMRPSDRELVAWEQLDFNTCHSVLAWSLLEEFLKNKTQHLRLPKNLVNLTSDIAYGMAEFGLLNLVDGIKSGRPMAEYYRRSAPEEALGKGDHS